MQVEGAWVAPTQAHALRLLYVCPGELTTRTTSTRQADASRLQAFWRRCGLRRAPSVLRVNRGARSWYDWEMMTQVSAMGGVG
jgi:hypothetical protein